YFRIIKDVNRRFIHINIWFIHCNFILEFFPILVSIEIGGIVQIINNISSSSPLVQHLLSQFVLRALHNNIMIKAEHIPGIINKTADSLSMLHFHVFWELQKDEHKKVAGVSFWAKLMRRENFSKEPLVQQVLKGLTRIKAKPDTRKPITVILLKKIINMLPMCMFKTLFVIVYFAAMRISEAVAPNKFAGKEVRVIEDKLRINIRVSKTDRKGTIIWLGHFADAQLCPCRSFQAFYQMCPHLDGSLFIHRNGKYISKLLAMCFEK
ncbi:hypothetical protein XELAEV_18034099mg, partial [Xenopus laevis]